jgi:hypothetical protein
MNLISLVFLRKEKTWRESNNTTFSKKIVNKNTDVNSKYHVNKFFNAGSNFTLVDKISSLVAFFKKLGLCVI